MKYSLLVTSIAGALLTVAFSGTLFPNSTPTAFLVASGGIFMTMSVLTGNTMNTVSPEYLPTRVRGSGVALFLTAGRIGNLSAQIVNSFLAAGYASLLCGLATFTLALGSSLTYNISIEPKGKTLENAACSCEHKDSEVEISVSSYL